MLAPCSVHDPNFSYRPQRSWGKVIFSQVSVIPWDQVHTPLGPGTYPPGPGTPPGSPGAVHAGRYGQQAGGTHPTGMHSC